MLQKLSRQAKACHKRAAEAKQKAEAAKDLVSKAILLEIEKQWLALARNYMSKESVGDLPASMPDRQPRPDERVRVNRSVAAPRNQHLAHSGRHSRRPLCARP